MSEKETFLQAAAAETIIATYPGLDLSGYAARNNPSKSKHDEVYARALALRDKNSTLLLLTVDLLGLESPIVKRAREAIQARLSAEGLLSDTSLDIMIAATHSHSGPAVMQLHGCGEVNTEWHPAVIEALTTVAVKAIQQLQPARLHRGSGTVEGVAMNRRNAAWFGKEIGGSDGNLSAGVTDTELGLLRIDSLQGAALACVLNFACHPVVLTETNVAITAEYPGVVCEAIKVATGAPTLFVTGAAADINPVHRGGWDAVEQTAQPIIEEALRVWQNAGATHDVTLNSTVEHLHLPLQPLPDAEELAQLRTTFQQQRETAQREGQAVLEHISNVYLNWIDLVEQTANGRSSDSELGHDIEVQTFRIGPAAIVAVPAELFVELGLRIKQNLKEQGAELVLIAGYANGNLGYIPSKSAYALGGYEVESAHRFYGHPNCVAPVAGEMVVDCATRPKLFVSQ